ncbi:Disease resistance protein RPM1 [Dichanthelium oligosanthes]|uniref:Disease resistance protein RPM1 n=1 Tax=Dichanthelium oligosanthes TaxID=888268 RepID=A0A1E5UP69_9POAL|nr:Disease resistance protein RPM1 [Dichanthelium oligosanthes]
MASASTGVMTSVIGKLTTLLGEEYTKLTSVQREVNFMKDELSSMNSLLQRLAEVDGDLDVQTKEWRRQVQEMSYDIEDCIDDFMHRIGHNGMADSAGLVNKVVRQIKLLRVRHQIASQIKDLKARVEDASKRHMRYKLDDRAFQSRTMTSIDPRLPSLYAEPEGLVGIDKPRDDLVRLLMQGEGSSVQQLKVVSVVGPGGLGKTTLANEVYRRLEGQFKCRAFVSLSQQPDVKKILSNILYQVSQQEYVNMEIWDEEKFINAIRDFLQRKRYLIVIDDIWSTQAWRTIKCALCDNNCGSRIMTTTRIVSIARSCCSPQHDHVYEIMPLSAHNSKSLLVKRIFGSENTCPPQLDEISFKILGKCKGVPLAIVTIASVLANKASTKEEWDSVHNSIGSTLEKDPYVEEMRRILSLSYDDLPQHLKTCLLYLSIFPEDYEIERDQVVRRWIAEGFINTEGGQDLEEIGKCYFNDLVNRSMIQPVKIKYDGRVVSCRVHDMILDLLISKSIEENFATFIGGKNQKLVLRGKARRLSLNYYFYEHTMVPSTMIISQCRSLSIFGYSDQMPSLSNCRALRVLDIENGEEMEHKYFEHIRVLRQLKYLRLNLRSITSLPEQLGELQHLRTLDLGETKIKNLPKSIVQLQNLTCLRITNLELPEEIGNLHALQELSVIKINQNSSASSLLGLGSLIKLRILRLYWCIVNTRPDSKAFVDNLLSSLRKLGRVNLRSLYIQSSYSYSIDFLLDSWFPTPHLLQTFVMGMEYHFPRIPFWIASLDNLTYLDINVDPVEQKALDVLGNLPSLLYLRVTSKATAHKEGLIISSSMFICLKEFHFTCWSSGVGLIFEVGAMMKLEKLRISFDVGAGLYFGFQHLSSLKHLVAEIICSGVTAQEVQALEEAIRNAGAEALLPQTVARTRMCPSDHQFQLRYSNKLDNPQRIPMPSTIASSLPQISSRLIQVTHSLEHEVSEEAAEARRLYSKSSRDHSKGSRKKTAQEITARDHGRTQRIHVSFQRR